RSSGIRSFAEHSFSASADSTAGGRNRPSRLVDHLWSQSRLAPATSCGRTRLGSSDISGANLSEGRPINGCVATRSNRRSLYNGDVRRLAKLKGFEVLRCSLPAVAIRGLLFPGGGEFRCFEPSG